MSMDRAEQAGIGASLAGHLLLFGLLAAGFAAVRPIEIPKRQTVEVSLVAETALESGAPEISNEAPAPKLAEAEAPIAPEPPPPEPVAKPRPEPVTPPKPVTTPKTAAAEPARPAPKPAARPQPKAAAKAPPARSGGRLDGILKGLSDDGGRATAPPAARITPAIQSSLGSEIMRQIRPHWSGPTGSDVDALKTVLKISLAKDGSVTKIQFVGTSGINASNRTIAPIHRERAEKAVRLASPFRLPAQFYDGWKSVTVNFDWRLQ